MCSDDKADEVRLNCLRYPPTINRAGSIGADINEFPKLYGYQWCGEYCAIGQN